MSKEDQTYGKTFSCCFQSFLWIANAISLIVIVWAVNKLSPGQHPPAKVWTEAGRWATGVAITPFVALAVAYAWMRRKVKSWPGFKDPVTFVFILCAVYLLISVFVFTFHPTTGLGWVEDLFGKARLYALGLVMPIGSLILQLVGLLTILRVLETQRDTFNSVAS